jgi:hypothetical protein
MDYEALLPEINSARMYAGAGSARLLAAASAWSELGCGSKWAWWRGCRTVRRHGRAGRS